MIKIENLHKSFGKNEVLKGITTTIEKGSSRNYRAFWIRKINILRCMNMLEAPTDGHIWIGTEEVTNPKTNVMHVRENVGMVFQHFHLFPHMTVLENITYAPINVKGVTKQEAEKKAEKLLEKVGLVDKKIRIQIVFREDKSNV